MLPVLFFLGFVDDGAVFAAGVDREAVDLFHLKFHSQWCKALLHGLLHVVHEIIILVFEQLDSEDDFILGYSCELSLFKCGQCFDMSSMNQNNGCIKVPFGILSISVVLPTISGNVFHVQSHVQPPNSPVIKSPILYLMSGQA